MARNTIPWVLAAVGCVLLAGCGDDVPDKIRSTTDSPPVAAATGTSSLAGKKVLLVQSYHAEYPWVASITAGVKKALEGTGCELEIFYMDTKRRTDEAWKVRAGELAQERVAQYKPDLVITGDDIAQQYFAKKYVNATPWFVFCGVNEDPSKYGFPASNITGINERPSFKSTIKYLKQLHPVKKVAVLSCDDETSIGALNFMKEELVDVEVVEFKCVKTFGEWKAAVNRYNETVDAFGVYMYHTITEGGGHISLDPKVVMEWTRQNARVPTFGFFIFGIEDGLLIGVVESGEEQGERAVKYGIELLKGTPITSLPIIKADIGIRMINRSTARQLGITLSPEVLQDAIVVPKE